MRHIVEFAMAQNTKFSPCYGLVSAWLKHNGVANTPSDTSIRRLWFRVGPLKGMEATYSDMGLLDASPQAGDVAAVEQIGGDPLCAIVAADGFCVVRSFGRLVVWKPRIIRAWGLPWERQ